MALWTAEKLQAVRAIIARYHAAIAIAVFGHKALPPDLLKDLRGAGVAVPDGPQLIDDAFAYGQLVALLRDPKLATKSPAEIAKLVEERKLPLQLSQQEKASVEVARQHAGQYVVGLGTRVAGQVMAAVTGAEANLTPERMVEIIADKTAGNRARRETIDSLRSDLGHAMGNWTRDWQRIAMTESNNAIQEGTASTIEKQDGAEQLVSKMPRPDACPDCKRLYLRGGQPIIFKLSELRANGSNVGRKKRDWKPTIEAIHPWCGCVLVRVPAGMEWIDGELQPKKAEPDEESDEGAQGDAAIVRGMKAAVEKSERPLEKAARKLHGRLTFAGMPISIENRRGSLRHWYDPVAKEKGATKVRYPYGYIRLTEAADGEHVDCYIGPDKHATSVYVVHQQKKKPDGSFGGYDEDKCFLGFASASEAKAAYLAHYNDPRFFGSMTAMTVPEFKRKLVEKKGEKLTKADPLVIDMRLEKGGTDPCPRCGAMTRLSDTDGAEPCWTCRKALEAAGTPYRRAGWDYENDRWQKSYGAERAGHKYISRRRGVDGSWEYKYAEPAPHAQLALDFTPPKPEAEQRHEAGEAGVNLDNYFASGSNHEGEIQGFASIGWNVGVAAHEVSDDAVRALHALKGTRTKVFVDSGAFSEVDFNFPARKDNAKKGIKAGDLPYPDKPIGPLVVAPISDAEWTKRLDLYDSLASSLGRQLYAVAPDQVAFQDETADRLAKYADRVREIHAKGANILVPLQKGKLSLADFDDKARSILGFDDYIRAIPMKKDATTTAEFEAFMAAKKPARVHLLGLGKESDRYDEVMAAAKRASPASEVFLDSVKITSAVERSKPTKAGGWSRPRKLTAATDRTIKRLAGEAFEREEYHENISYPGEWLPPKQRAAVGARARLSLKEMSAFKKDPTKFLEDLRAADKAETTDNRQAVMLHVLEAELNSAWSVHFAGIPGAEIEQHHGKGTVTERKRDAIVEAFGGGKLAHLKTRAEIMHEHAMVDSGRPVPAHRIEADYRWEGRHDAEAEHREAISHALHAHEMSAPEYTKLHEADYGPVADFYKDPFRGPFLSDVEKPKIRDAIDVLKSAAEALEQLGSSPARLGMMSWRGNEDSPRPERPANIVGISDEMGLTVKGKKKRKKQRDEGKAVARASRLSPEDRFKPAKRMRKPPKGVQHFAPDTLKDAREGAREGAEVKRERIRDDLARRQANKPPMDPVRIARARGEA